jgi:hypothetical protein
MRSKIASKSIINKLTHEGVVSQDLLVLINNLTLEDLIAIKLELSCALVKNKLYGLTSGLIQAILLEKLYLSLLSLLVDQKKMLQGFLD